jgi:hypothetical protein
MRNDPKTPHVRETVGGDLYGEAGSPPETMYRNKYDSTIYLGILADGQEWIDSNGNREWPELEAIALADSLELIGYEVELF